MKTEYIASQKEETESMNKILDNIYEKVDLGNVEANTTHINDQEIKLLLVLLNKFEELFDAMLKHWDTYLVYIR